MDPQETAAAAAAAEPKGAVSICLPAEAQRALPLTIKWRVPAGSHVVEGQVLAHLFPPPAAAAAAAENGGEGAAAAAAADAADAHRKETATAAESPAAPAAEAAAVSPAARPGAAEAAEATEEAEAAKATEAADSVGPAAAGEAARAREAAGSAEARGAAEAAAADAAEGGAPEAAATGTAAAAAADGGPPAASEFVVRAPVSGVLCKLSVLNNEIISSSTELGAVAATACEHPLAVGGICLCCLAAVGAAAEGKVQAGFLSAQRELRVDVHMAKKLERERVISLINRRKLCLVLDLDNTLLHATSVPPPVDCLPTILLDDFAPKPDRQQQQQHQQQAQEAADGTTGAAAAATDAAAPGEATNAEAERGPDGNPQGEQPSSSSSSSSSKSSRSNGSSSSRFSAPQQQTWEEVCFPPCSSSSSSSREYPHYRTDAAAARIVSLLESSVICCRVAADEGDTWGPPYHRSVIKLRPGSISFLREMSRHFELFLYTMGTSTHAKTALRLLDPALRFFGPRVFTRGDSVGGLKSLRRIFSLGSKLSVAVDDLQQIWKEANQCVQVHGYFFFAEAAAAAAARALQPAAASLWLAAATPYCGFLPS
ncbi:NLI interacting factor-like phosphatase domain-containing protein, putative, partial [Eimeria tenella]